MFKKIAILLIAVLMVLSFAPMNVSADQTSDTFDITVTGEYLWIDITNTSWAIGTIAMNSVHYTNETGITFIADMSDSSVDTDLKLQVTNDGAQWSAAVAAASPGVDTYRLNASIDVWVAANDQVVTASASTISSGVVAGQDESFDLRFDAPTSTSVGTQQSITVTASLVKS